MTRVSRVDRFAPVALAVFLASCGGAPPTQPTVVGRETVGQPASSDSAGLSASTYYCFGSYRRLGINSYSYATNQQFGGALPAGGVSAMLNTCRDRIRVDPTWLAHLCDGLAAGIHWTVSTDHCVKTCPTCGIGQSCSAFSAACYNGVVTP